MIVSELVAQIAKRLNDENNIMYSKEIIKSYLFPAMSVVFLTEGLTLSDYPGLILEEIVTDNFSYTFTSPVKRIISVIGYSNTNRYIYKTVEEMDALVGSDFLDPEEGERFYYLVGNKLSVYGASGSDESFKFKALLYPTILGDAIELGNYYSTTFIELSVRETINTILKELDVRT